MDRWTQIETNTYNQAACTHKHRKKDGTDRLRYKHKHITNGRTDVKNDFHANINIQSQTNRWMDGDTTIHT